MTEPQQRMTSAQSSDPEFWLPDVNILVALTNPSHQHHVQARQWLSGVKRFATTPITENGLVRLLLNPAVVGQSVTGEQAARVLSGLRASTRATFVPDASSLADPYVDLIGLTGHRQATDFHLVNLAAQHGGALVTFDRRIGSALARVDQKFVRILD
ncbi:MAG: TA system VapC family ribonuclease toxin [Streptosporangiaceae bacterium]